MDTGSYQFKSLEEKYGGFRAPAFEISLGGTKLDSSKFHFSSITVDIDAGQQAGGCSFTAAVTADYGETTADFTLEASFAPDTGASLTVTAPETIAGITAHVKDSAADVSFDDTQLGLGSLANGRLAPLAAPYVLGQSWAGAYIDSTGTEDGLLRATYRLGYDKQELVVDTWFTEEPFTPQYAEISADGRMVLSIRISNFAMQ